jgi:hypothetical protein
VPKEGEEISETHLGPYMNGKQGALITVYIQHVCEGRPKPVLTTVRGRDHAEAEASWNMGI